MGLLDKIMTGYSEAVLSGGGRRGAGADSAGNANTAAASYDRLQRALAENYSQQKAADPNWQMPGPQERFVDQVQAMILSGDPILQKRGLELMEKPAERKKSNIEEQYDFLAAENPGLSRTAVFNQLHPGPAQTRVNITLPKQDQPMTFEDAQKLDWSQVPGGYQPGMSMMDAGRAGARLAATKDQAESNAATNTMEKSMAGMESNTQTTADPIMGAASELRSKPGLIGQTTNAALNAAGIPQNPADVKFIADRAMYVGQLTKAMNGAGASDQERENWMSQAPKLTDSPEQRRVKLKIIRDATNEFNKVSRNKGGNLYQGSGAPAQQSGPQVRTTKSGVKYTVE